MTDPLRTAPASNGQLRTAPASYGQRRLWFFDRLQPQSSVYNTQSTITFLGPVDRDALERAANEMVRRHEVLRTLFRNEDGNPIQVVQPPDAMQIAVPLTDLSDLAEDRRERELRRILLSEYLRIFDLERGPLINLVLVRLEARRHLLSVAVHHIIYDDWSVEVFDRELNHLYADAKAERPFSLPGVALQFASFSAEQFARFDENNLDPQLAYWRHQLRDLPDPISLPTDRPRGTGQTFPGAIRKIFVGTEVSLGFRALTRAANATLFMSLFAAFAVLLSRFSGDTDLVLGTPIANRNRPELANLIGFLVNTLVLRIDLSDDPGFVDLLARAREVSLGAFENQDVPFELLVEELGPVREASRQPLIQTMFIFMPARGPMDGSGPKDAESCGAKFDLAMTGIDAAPNICGELEYNTDLFDKTSMARMAACFETLIASIVADPTCPVSKLPLLPASDREQILARGRGIQSKVPATCVHEIVRELAAAHPESIAVARGSGTLGFGALVQRADTLARELRRLDLAPEARIGLLIERSPDWIAAMLGILAAGCAIVPLDPALPAERIAFMVEDAGVDAVMTERRLSARLNGDGVRVIFLSEIPVEGPVHPGGVLPRVDLRSLAYIIFTSGSTGRPKGVLVEHAGLTNLALAQGREWGVDAQARVLQFASIGFDAAMSEVFSTLCCGGRICLMPSADTMPGPALLRTLRDQRISHVTLPPSALAAMQPESVPELRVVISAGERCESDLARRWANGRRFFNAYGPTEATVCATMHEYADDAVETPIGRPLSNVEVHVLDRHGEPTPVGVTGEIHIGGRGVARGYANRAELTRERFIQNHLSGDPASRLYRTGDLGRFDAAGMLHYLGRRDGQLKIRGYRIEPGEVESVMRAHPQVRDALVVPHGHGADARLVAYFIADETPPLVIELRSFLARQLPDYMSPSVYIMVEAWPKTGNGKVDRSALPRPDGRPRDGAQIVAPNNGLEETVASIWRECLEVQEVGATDNFFDLGGHSLLLVKVYDKLKGRLKFDLSLVDMFRFPTVKSQATMLADRLSSNREDEALGRTDQRAARQNAARLQRRQRIEIQRHA